MYLGNTERSGSEEPSKFLDGQALRVGGETRVGHVMGVAPFVEVSSVAGHLDVTLSAQTLALALSAGYEGDIIKQRLEQLAPLPDPIERLLAQASAVIGRAEFVPVQGFLWVEDPEIRELLRTRRQTADLFVDPSPPAGLLIAPGVDLDRLARRCRGLGIELMVEGEVYRSRSGPPSSRNSGARRYDSSTSMKAVDSGRLERRQSGTRRTRSSSQTMPAIQIKRGSGGGE